MTLTEAIRILDTTQAPPLMHPMGKYNDALKLGIEALKRVKAGRPAPPSLAFQTLPGETGD